MGVQDEARDPWTYVVGGLSGGMTWAVLAGIGAAAAPIGLAVGGAVVAAKILAGAFFRSDTRRRMVKDRRLPVATRTPEAAWLNRAERAQVVFDQIAGSARGGPIADHVRTFGDETAESLGALQRLAGQASAIRTAMARLDPQNLAWERDRILNAAQQVDDPALLAERQRSLDSVQSQLDAYARLDRTLAMLIARLESGTLGIEGLVARLAEVVAIAETSSVAAGSLSQVDELALELEGLRAGLVEAESVTTRAMQGLAPLPSTAPGTVPGTVPESPAQTGQVRRRAGGS